MSESTDLPRLANLVAGEALSARLRHETRPDHALVDAAFGRLDLAEPAGYIAFLVAQARVLPALEAALRPAELVSGWRGRTAAILRDLADLAVPPPPPVVPDLPEGPAARWGALYVLEGSRLGGAVLRRRVPAGRPSAFLGAVHPPGAWRETLARLDAANHGAAAQAEAVQAARAVFAAFARSAGAKPG